jgi:hypothetical protein
MISTRQTFAATAITTPVRLVGTLGQCEDWVENLIGQSVFVLGGDSEMVEVGIVQMTRRGMKFVWQALRAGHEE